jgi:hypothetical protein
LCNLQSGFLGLNESQNIGKKKKTFSHFQLSFVHVHIERSRFELKKRKEFKLRICKAGEGVGHDARARISYAFVF